MSKFLIGCIAVETRNARLNGSSKDVEGGGSTVQNIAYTKKIRSKNGIFPYGSGVYVKKNIKDYARSMGHTLSTVKSLSTTEVVSEGNPYKNYDEDVMGFMIASKLVLNEDEFNELPEDVKATFKKTTKRKDTIYEKNITKKRKARLMVSPLQAISSTKINSEFNVRQTDATSLLYTKEIYANIMSMGFNLDIENVGVFAASTDESGFRDYSNEEIEAFSLRADENGVVELPGEEKNRRIKDTLKAIQYFNTDIAQANNLEDLNAKFVIMADYSIGNNIFNNVFRNGILDIDYLVEAIEENEEFRLSPIYIGVRSGFMEIRGKRLKNIIEETFNGNDNVVIGTVGEAFDKYIKELY
ncbi:MAG: type I-B CRISPR-associated protein Cas7/Cst2/DevR [Bacilli bacterium]|nr:type I-B CRISPR-associated protein Cas7/Cst2/DevR [Bacilli bacterium]